MNSKLLIFIRLESLLIPKHTKQTWIPQHQVDFFYSLEILISGNKTATKRRIRKYKDIPRKYTITPWENKGVYRKLKDMNKCFFEKEPYCKVSTRNMTHLLPRCMWKIINKHFIHLKQWLFAIYKQIKNLQDHMQILEHTSTTKWNPF